MWFWFSPFILWDSNFFAIYVSLGFCCAGWSKPYLFQCKVKGSHNYWFALCRCAQEPTGADDLEIFFKCFYAKQTIFFLRFYLPPWWWRHCHRARRWSWCPQVNSQTFTLPMIGLAWLTFIFSRPLILLSW